ncbi:hypothetical protein [uncultured Tateyamaria sp.]|uniref:CBU_0592 family membrane protein n=1 Tax=uncultured Tateyamaria sp. TaxID=455651 RepID=UPI00263094BE|nr:hypothetical protein [uncultured Tateyamaria sp.]
MPYSLLETMHIYEVVGILGFALYVMNYGLLTTRCLSGDCLTYFTINLIAASCVLLGLMASFNLASALIQVFWVAMSIVGILIRLRRRRYRTLA